MLAARIDVGSVLLWGGLLMAAVAVLGGAAWWIRQRLLKDSTSGGEGIWTLQQLRDLRAAGQLSEAEFERLRAEMIGRHRLPTTQREAKTDVDASAASAPED